MIPKISGCSNLIQEGTLMPISGMVLYDCGEGVPAFTVRGNPSLAPTFILTSSNGTVGPLGISTDQCSTQTNLVSGQRLHLVAVNYVYCLMYREFPFVGGTIQSFRVTWA